MTGNPDYDCLVGTRALYGVTGDLSMYVTVIDVRRAYSRTDVQIAPSHAKGGMGAAWVSVDRLQLKEGTGV